MSSIGAAFRLVRAGWVLVREGVVAALPGDELSGAPKFGWRVARLLARRRALRLPVPAIYIKVPSGSTQ